MDDASENVEPAAALPAAGRDDELPARASPLPARAGAAASRAAASRFTTFRLAALALVVTIGVTVYLISTRVFTYNIRNNDTVAHLFQAYVFAMGKLYVPSPPMPEAFQTCMVVNDGKKMYSKYDPGHSAVLALGLKLLGSFKRTIAVIAALNALLAYSIALALWRDRKVALLVLVVLLFSPFFIIASATELPHTSSFMWNAAFLLCLIHALRGDRPGYGLMAGLALGASFNTRMLEALSFAAPGVIVLAWRAAGVAPLRRPPFLRLLGTRRRLATLGLFVLGFALLAAVSLAYNRALTGDPFTLPRQRWDPNDRPQLWLIGTPKAFLDQYFHKHLWVMWYLADHFFPVAMGYQVLVALFLLVARDAVSWLLISIILIHPLPFITYWYYGDYWSTGEIGPRYLFSLLLPLALMAAKLLAEIYRRLGRAGRWGRWPVAAALVYLTAEAAIRADLPWWLAREHENTIWRASLREQVLPPAGERAIVFVSCWPLGLGEPDGMFWNRPSFDDTVLFARNRGIAANLDLQRRLYPDRPIYAGKALVDPESFVAAWDLLGPFPAPTYYEALEKPWIDEKQAGEIPVGGWRPYRCSAEVPVVDFAAAFAAAFAGQPCENAAAYARATLHAGAPARVWLRYGSDDGIAVWLDGKEVAREAVARGADLDQGAVEVELRPGPNPLLVKVSQAVSSWELVLRVTDANGARPPGLTFTTPLLDRPALSARR